MKIRLTDGQLSLIAAIFDEIRIVVRRRTPERPIKSHSPVWSREDGHLNIMGRQDPTSSRQDFRKTHACYSQHRLARDVGHC